MSATSGGTPSRIGTIEVPTPAVMNRGVPANRNSPRSNDRPSHVEVYKGPSHGRIPAGQDKSAGTYTDTIVATINF